MRQQHPTISGMQTGEDTRATCLRWAGDCEDSMVI